MLIAGVDDSGRGSVIGPLVIAGVTFKDHQIPILQDLGVKDSKALTPKKRTRLNIEIEKLAIQREILELSPSEVDKIVLEGWKYHRLNWLEAISMGKVIRKLCPEVAYVDASDVDTARFSQQIKEELSFDVEIVSEHHADANYAVVSAASIVAKVHRDKAVAFLRSKFGNFGSGYSSDPKTREFLSNLAKKRTDMPAFVRKSWKTVRRLMEKNG